MRRMTTKHFYDCNIFAAWFVRYLIVKNMNEGELEKVIDTLCAVDNFYYM